MIDLIKVAKNYAHDVVAEANGTRDVILDLINEIQVLKEGRADLEAFVAEFAEAKFDALPQHYSSPEDEPDAITDAEMVWAYQQDAKDLIAQVKA